MKWQPNYSRGFDALLVVATVGVALAGWLDFCDETHGMVAQIATVLGGFVLAGAAVFLVSHRIKQARKDVLRHVDRICQTDIQDFLTGDPTESWPRLPDSNPWKSTGERLRDLLRGVVEQLRQNEHARAKAEVRCHRLMSERRQMADILAGLNEPVLAIDQFDEVVFTNPSAERLFQFGDLRNERQALRDLVRCEDLVNLLSETRRRKVPTLKTGEIEIENPDGGPGWYRVTTRDLPLSHDESGSDGGCPHGAIAVLRDIGNQKDSQRRHAEFISSVSHEMKTPLAGIKAYVELLADGDAEDEETREEFLDVINGQADRLQRLIDNLLNLARIEAGVVEVNKKPQALNDVLEEALRVVQPGAEEKQIEIAGDLSPMYLGVLIDRDMLLQAAINLLSNAVKYTREGGRVTIRSRLHGDRTDFEVEDNGVGLSEEDCQRVFDKFYRVMSNRGMARGTGLGLPLAKHIVEDVHGGKLTVQSTEGEGSTFRVTLPTAGNHE